MPRYDVRTKITSGLIGENVDTSIIPKSYYPDMLNVTKYGDFIGQIPGRTSYGSCTGIVMHYYHFKLGDYNKFIKFTNTNIYTRSSSGWDDVTGSVLTGTINNYIDSCTVYDATTGTPYVVFTNGKDNIRKYTGTGNTSDMSGWTSYKARFVRYYKGYLIAFHLTDSGTRYGFRLRCSDTDFPNDTTGTNSKTFNLTQDKNLSDIIGVEYFGDYLAIFKTDCIYLMSLSSSTSEILRFDVAVQNIGLRASRAKAADSRGSLFFLGYDDVYYWASPTSSPQGLTNRLIKKELFEETSAQNLERSILIYNPAFNQIRIYVPIGDYLNRVYCLDMNEDQWSWWKESVGNITGVGLYLPSTITTIDDLTSIYGTIDGMGEVQIDQLSGQLTSNFPILIEGDKDGESKYIDESKYNNINFTIKSNVVTGEDIFVSADGKPFTSDRVMGLRFEAKGVQETGDRLYIYYSVDEGNTWTAITKGLNLADFSVWSDYVSLSDKWMFYEAHFDIMTRKVQFKLANEQNNSTFYFRKMAPIIEDGDFE